MGEVIWLCAVCGQHGRAVTAGIDPRFGSGTCTNLDCPTRKGDGKRKYKGRSQFRREQQ